MAFAPHQPSPLARTTSPFKDPRTPPTTPCKTAKRWDACEKRAVENARRREGASQGLQPQRSSASDLPRNSATIIASARSSFDLLFRSRATASSSSSTTATCKSCKQPIAYASGICEPCKTTIILPPSSGDFTPPLSPSSRNFASSDLQELHRKLSREEKASPQVTSPKRRSFCPMPPNHMPPIRLSSLHPPPGQEPAVETTRTRKISLTDPNEAVLRFQIAPTAYPPRSGSHPASPTYQPTTPPSTSHSRTSTRPSSLANPVSPLSPAVHIPTHAYGRHNSATSSEMSSLYPHKSQTASLYTGYGLTSAWDDWDSDGEDEKTGLVTLLKSIGKAKKKERADSMNSAGARLNSAREEERKKSRDQRRKSEESHVKEANEEKKRPSGFVRAISCGGCSSED
ncbi:hypothetical protein ACEQ8H_002544 [Pleosporales sp. CAS-2024a]